jgi:DNA recombination protein RmuC
MLTAIIISNIILIAAIGAAVFFAARSRGASMQEAERTAIDDLRKEIQANLNSNAESLRAEVRHLQAQVAKDIEGQTTALRETGSDMNQRLDKAAHVISDVQKELGRMSTVARSIDELQNILKAPKMRGGLGELFLGDLLGQILPAEHFELQHRFKNGEAVDAVIHLGEKTVPVDSKFPLENFQKMIAASDDEVTRQSRRQFINDVKKHIQAVSKYIRTDEETHDFALMYIPAENVYYEIAVKEDAGGEARELLNYALKCKVIPVSPNTFYAYLMTVMVGLRGLKIEKHASAILAKMARVQKDFGGFQSVFEKLGSHLENARKSYEDADKRLTRVDGKLQEFEVAEGTPSLPEPKAVELNS